jgi:predicted transcriptional regulator
MKKQIIPENLTKALLQLNLTEKEVATYVILLQNGSMSAQDISRETGVNRVSIYSAIDELKSKGLLSESRKGKKKLFVAESPENLKTFLEGKKENLDKEEKLLENIILPSLKALDISIEKRPQILFFEGIDGINQVYDNYMLKHKDIIGCGSYEAALRATNWKYEKQFLEEVKKRRIVYRGILRDTPIDRKFAEVFREYFHIKFLNLEEKLTADIHVFGSYVSLMSYDTMTATLLHDEAVAKSIKMYLDFMWERL